MDSRELSCAALSAALSGDHAVVLLRVRALSARERERLLEAAHLLTAAITLDELPEKLLSELNVTRAAPGPDQHPSSFQS